MYDLTRHLRYLKHAAFHRLDKVRKASVVPLEATCYLYWSRAYGYLDEEQMLFLSKA